MGVFENLPYANFHELNLDWIIKALKESIETLQDGVDYIQQVEQEVQALDLASATSELNRQKAQLQKLVNTPDFVALDANLETLGEMDVITSTVGGVYIGRIANLHKGLWIFQAVLTVRLGEPSGPAVSVSERAQLLTILGVRNANNAYTASSRNTSPVSGAGAHCSSCVTLIANVNENESVDVYAQRNPLYDAETEAEAPRMLSTNIHIRGYRVCSDTLTASN